MKPCTSHITVSTQASSFRRFMDTLKYKKNLQQNIRGYTYIFTVYHSGHTEMYHEPFGLRIRIRSRIEVGPTALPRPHALNPAAALGRTTLHASPR